MCFFTKVVGMVIALPWTEVTPITTDSTQRRKSRLTFVEISLDAENETLAMWCRYNENR